MKINVTPSNFIEEEIIKDLKSGRVNKVTTRFPPEPSGYWHIGHLKAISINFETAKKFGGTTTLRMDDTNPAKEDGDFAESYLKELAWLGYKPAKFVYASVSYFSKIYKLAIKLIKKGLAYVCDLSAEEVSATRGTLTEAGTNSPYRNRSVSENLLLFKQMQEGKFKEGEKTLRAKIDMASNNINMRDPVIYRILNTPHYKVGNKWKVYPAYDFAHPLQDKLEKITFSLCDITFEDHRPLYNWVLEACGFKKNNPRQIEFGKMNIENVLLGKRYLKQLVNTGVVLGWDDPRLLTLAGMRRRGYPAAAVKNFIKNAGVAKNEGLIEMASLEACVRDELNKTATRVMAVLDPLKIVITNYDKKPEAILIENNQTTKDGTVHSGIFDKEIYIEKEDFAINPPPKYNRLTVGGYVRLKSAYIIKCNKVIENEKGEIDHLECEYIENSRSGNDESGLKVKGVIHFVSASGCEKIKIREFKNLIKPEFVNVSRCLNDGTKLEDMLNSDTLNITEALAEKFVLTAKVGEVFQFIRKGYYCLDNKDDGLTFNETVSLKDGFKPKSN